MRKSRLRAPFTILHELLGEPDEDHGMDKTSTCFAYVFEGHDVFVHDFHKEEWGSVPRCRTDSEYVWEVFSDEDVEAFCRWLSSEVQRSMRSSAGGRSLDKADRARLNELLAEGAPLDNALTRVRLVAGEHSARYAWPPPGDDSPAMIPLTTATTRTPRSASAAGIVRRRRTPSRPVAPIDKHRRRCARISLLVEQIADESQAAELRASVAALGSAARQFVALASADPDIDEHTMQTRLAVNVTDFATICREVDQFLAVAAPA